MRILPFGNGTKKRQKRRRARRGGNDDGLIRYETKRILKSSNDREFEMILQANFESRDVQKIILRQEYYERGKDYGMDREHDVMHMTVNGLNAEVKETREKAISSTLCILKAD